MGRTASPERFAAQKQRVLEKAAELFAQKGYHATTLDDIAEGLDMTKPAIYYYVPSKQDIVAQLYELIIDRVIERGAAVLSTDDPPDVKLRKMMVGHMITGITEMSGVTAHLHLQFTLSGKTRAKIVRKRDKYEKMWRDLIQEGIDKGVFIKCDPVLVGIYILSLIMYLPNWYKASGPLSVEAIGEYFADLALRALLVSNPEGVELPLSTLREVVPALG